MKGEDEVFSIKKIKELHSQVSYFNDYFLDNI